MRELFVSMFVVLRIMSEEIPFHRICVEDFCGEHFSRTSRTMIVPLI